MVRRAKSNNPSMRQSFVLARQTECDRLVVRESCYPFYEPSYSELSHGCSQEIQSFKEW
jgi:hypothetical protein